MNRPEIDLTIVGGGIVGCAVADAAARSGRTVVLLEQEPALARGTTSRNSEVAHGGMYYPTGSLKARFCVEGRRLLRAFSAEAGLAWRECGKLIVAVEADEVPALERLHALGLANGVEDLQLLDAAELRALEPEVRAVAALLSPRTAVCDAEGLARGLARRAVEHGAQVLTGAAGHGPGAGRRRLARHRAPATGGARAGPTPARRSSMPPACTPTGWRRWPVSTSTALRWRQVLVRGNYFSIDSRHRGRVGRLVYPLPPADGSTLGVAPVPGPGRQTCAWGRTTRRRCRRAPTRAPSPGPSTRRAGPPSTPGPSASCPGWSPATWRRP